MPLSLFLTDYLNKRVVWSQFSWHVKFFVNSVFNWIVFIKAKHNNKTCSRFPLVLLCKTLFSIKLDSSRLEKVLINHISRSKNAHRTNSDSPLF